MERQGRIRGMIATMGRVSSRELASRFCVSEDTIRRDLRALNRTGAVLKVYGGAVRAGTADPPSFLPRRAAGGALVDVTLRLIGPSQSILPG
ncbi:DeoR family transcriptional regulator [Rhizobium sp. BR 249]|uniref:DeoR family transcriptional regulator n=1 Tax=Rhizobium sp. BR 249 TaxID=3040011 RepID=UPI0039BF6CA9